MATQAELEKQVDRIAWRQDDVVQRVADHEERIVVGEKADAAIAVEVKGCKTELAGVRAAVDKLIWFIVGLALTIATSSVGIVIEQILSHQGGS
jgi:hypothetical protein